jgi:hypothetical protein
MKTTIAQIRRPVEVEEENRFDLAGRLLARAEILLQEGEAHDHGLLTRLAQVVAAEGPEYARGWLEGAHYTAGVRIHDAWMIGTDILQRRKTQDEIREEVRASLLEQIEDPEPVIRQGRFRPCARCGRTPAQHNPLQAGHVGHDYE